jgi:hypothetical protein
VPTGRVPIPEDSEADRAKAAHDRKKAMLNQAKADQKNRLEDQKVRE